MAVTATSDDTFTILLQLDPTGYARPKSATPATVALVPAFEPCEGFDVSGNHGPPLTNASCDPPVQSRSPSNFPNLTFNAPDRPPPYNTLAEGKGSVTFKVTNAGGQADVNIGLSLGDVRCYGSPGQGGCAGSAGSLYGGKVLLTLPLRITDRFNGVDFHSSPGTVADTILNVGFQCAVSNGACNGTTSVNSVYPGLALALKRAVWALGDVAVYDGGTDGNLVAAPSPASGACPPACIGNDGETVFLRQGLFLP
jgi:hypothetical protein